jgi:hypothetical protein
VVVNERGGVARAVFWCIVVLGVVVIAAIHEGNNPDVDDDAFLAAVSDLTSLNLSDKDAVVGYARAYCGDNQSDEGIDGSGRFGPEPPDAGDPPEVYALGPYATPGATVSGYDHDIRAFIDVAHRYYCPDD